MSSAAWTAAIWVSTGSFAAFAGFGAFVWLGGELSAALLFACLALFAMLDEPLGMVSHLLARM